MRWNVRWIPVILLSHSQAAGSHGGKLSVRPKSGKGFHRRHLFRCATEWRKSLTNTYRTENKQSLCASVITCGRHDVWVLTLRESRANIFFFYIASFYCSILSSTEHEIIRWTNQMGFYLLSGIQRRDLDSKFVCHVSDFYGLMATSLLQSTGGKGTFVEPTMFQTKLDGSYVFWYETCHRESHASPLSEDSSSSTKQHSQAGHVYSKWLVSSKFYASAVNFTVTLFISLCSSSVS